MKFLKWFLGFLVGSVKFVKKTFFIALVSTIALFVLAIFMPDNTAKAIEIFKNLFNIP